MITLDQGGAARGTLDLTAPDPDLAHLAELAWIQRVGPDARPGWRIVPDTHPHLMLHRSLDGRSALFFVGPRSTWVDISRQGREFTVGVRLRPGALAPLIGTSAWSLRDRAVRAADAVAPSLRHIVRRAQGTSDSRLVRKLLMDLLRGCDTHRPIDWRVRGFTDLVLSPSGPREPAVTVRGATERLGISERGLRDVYKLEVGLRPKEAQRIARVLRALGHSLVGRPDAIAATAAGYVDQAHLIRDTRALLGETPREFRARADSSNTGRSRDR